MTSSCSSCSTHKSPLARLQSELASEIKTGKIKSGDQDALSSALSSIDSSLSAGRADGSGPGDPSQIDTKISSLIDGQVSAGKLTSDQASELKGLFDNAKPTGGHHGGPRGAGGPPPPPPPDAADQASAAASSDPSSTSSSSDPLADFLKQLQGSLAQQGYGQDGTTTSATSSLLFSIKV